MDGELERQDLTTHLEPGLIGMVVVPPSVRLTIHKPSILFPLHLLLHVYKKNRNKIEKTKTQKLKQNATKENTMSCALCRLARTACDRCPPFPPSSDPLFTSIFPAFHY